MNRAERSAAVLAMLAQRGTVEVEQLVEQLGVSPATVRRDLDALAEQQLLVRTHGGATRGAVAYDLSERYRLDDDQAKRAVARHAAAEVQRGMVVGLSGGTTTGMVAQLIGMRTDLRDQSGRPTLTVVTNSVNIASTLAVRTHIKVVVAGGVMHPHSYELVGPFAEETIGRLTCDIAFIGVDGADPAVGFTVDEEAEAHVNALIATRAQQAWVVATAAKLSLRRFAALGHVPGLGLITDASAHDAAVLAWRQAGVEVRLAQETDA